MTVEQIKSEAELYLASLQDQILPLQEDYVSTIGKFWQGVGTPDPVPEDGDDAGPDPDVARDGLPSWLQFGVDLPFFSTFSVRCDEEKWPDGSLAFVIVAYFGWDGGIWEGKVRHKGSWEDLRWDYTKFG